MAIYSACHMHHLLIRRFRFASNQLGLLVRGAEIILSTLYPWVDPVLRAQIDDWFFRKEECIACIASSDHQQSNPSNQNPIIIENDEGQESQSSRSYGTQERKLERIDSVSESEGSDASSC